MPQSIRLRAIAARQRLASQSAAPARSDSQRLAGAPHAPPVATGCAAHQRPRQAQCESGRHVHIDRLGLPGIFGPLRRRRAVQDEDRWYPYPNDPARKIGFIIASARAQRRNDVIRQRA